MKEIEDLEPDVQAIAKRCEAIRKSNSLMVTQMERIGVAFDIGLAKLEHFMGCLIDMKIMTDEQYWAICIEWEESFQRQLHKADRKIREQIANQQNQRQQELTGLVTPEEKKIIIPGR
jgi:hypothetical protein